MTDETYSLKPTKLVVHKSVVGDLVALAGLNVIPCILLLELAGIISLFGTRWPWYAISIVTFSISLPIWLRFFSTAPLIEADLEKLTIYVGLLRRHAVRIDKRHLLNADSAAESSYGEQIKVLKLLFAEGALHELTRYQTPYLSVSRNEVLIPKAHIDGDISKLAESLMGGQRG